MDVRARLRAPVGTGEQAYHEQVWSLTLALATTKGMVGRPHDRAVQACDGLDQSPSSCHAAAPSSWWLWWPADAPDQGCGSVGGGLWEVCISPIFMLPLLSHASWELSGRWCAAWHSLMTMVIFTMHQTHDLPPPPTVAEADGRAWDRAVS